MHPPALKPRLKVLHPFAFALQPVVTLYAANANQLQWTAPIRSALIMVLGAAGLWALFSRLLRDREKGALITSLFIFAFFSWGHFVDYFVPPLYKTRYFTYYAIAFSTLTAFFLIFKSTRPWTRVFNLVGGLLLVFPLLTLLIKSVAEGGRSFSILADDSSAWKAAAEADFTERDILVLLLDGYPRADVLRDDYDFDNLPFLDELEARGFHVATDSYANYNGTPWTLGSALNGDYIGNLLEIDERSTNLRPLVQLFQENRVFNLFARRGYVFYAFETGFELVDMKQPADYFLAPRHWGNEFETLLLQLTPVPAACQRFSGRDALFERHRERIHFAFAQLRTLAREPVERHRFIWAHLIVPHDPIVFGPEGEPVNFYDRFVWASRPPAHMTWTEYASRYGDQLYYVNRKVLELVDAFFLRPDPRPIIIIISDHGPSNLQQPRCAAKFKNLCAIYVPEDIDWKPPRDLELVNLFPALINASFDLEEPIPLQEEFRLRLVSWDRPYCLKVCEK